MRIACIFTLLCLMGCAPVATTLQMTPSPGDFHTLPTDDWSSYLPSTGAFEFSSTCPHLCWLGIDPGETSSDEASRILSASNQIDQASLTGSDTGILASWFTEGTQQLSSSIYLHSEQGIVQSVSFEMLAPWTIQDLVNLLGDPDGILISMETQGDVMNMPYSLYFSSARVLATADAGDPGPHPADAVVSLKLNLEYDQEHFQTWIGFGHLDVYLASQPIHAHPASNP